MTEERLVELRWGRGVGKLRKTGGGLADGPFFRRPYRLGGRRGLEGGPVVSLCLLDGLKVG